MTRRKKERSSSVGSLKSFFSNAVKKLGRKGDKSSEDEGTSKPRSDSIQESRMEMTNVALDVLTQFTTHFANFLLPLEKAMDLVLGFCQKYGIAEEQRQLLISELETFLRRCVIDQEDERQAWETKRNARLKEWVNNTNLNMLGSQRCLANSGNELKIFKRRPYSA